MATSSCGRRNSIRSRGAGAGIAVRRREAGRDADRAVTLRPWRRGGQSGGGVLALLPDGEPGRPRTGIGPSASVRARDKSVAITLALSCSAGRSPLPRSAGRPARGPGRRNANDGRGGGPRLRRGMARRLGVSPGGAAGPARPARRASRSSRPGRGSPRGPRRPPSASTRSSIRGPRASGRTSRRSSRPARA